MQRRTFVLGALATLTAAEIGLKPGDKGQPYDDYFSAASMMNCNQLGVMCRRCW